LSIAAALTLTLVLGIDALLSIRGLSASLNTVVEVNAEKLYLASDMNTVLSDFTAGERGAIARARIKDFTTVERFNKEFGLGTVRFKQRVDAFVPLIASAETLQVIQPLQMYVDTITQDHQQLYRMAMAGDAEGAQKLLRDKEIVQITAAKAITEELVQRQRARMAAAAASARSSVVESQWIATFLIALSLVIGAILVYIVREITGYLRQTIADLSDGADEMTHAAFQVSSSSQSLAQGSSQQAAALEETSASSQEINSMALKGSENSRNAADLVTQSQQKFVQANQSLDQMVMAMSEINTQSGKISKIIKVIDDIAFQTNILALNAAVEAARAGEAGMGFAVVADEVRSLAQRSAQAARDTAGLIEESIAKSKDGKLRVDQVASAIRSIGEESAKVKTLMEELDSGSRAQASGIAQISKAIAQMEQITQSTAANAEQSASAAEELNAQSETLKDVVNGLRARVGGIHQAESQDRKNYFNLSATFASAEVAQAASLSPPGAPLTETAPIS
jgi:methyl-accepting chemotaxis protein